MTPLNGYSQNETTCSAIRRNVQAVANLEEDFNKKRSLSDRIADGIGGFAGSLLFVLLHLGFYTLWVLLNIGVVPLVPRFDPFPFMLLNVGVSLEAIFLSTFVLMKQNRMSKRADQRANLDLQINLLAEREMTLMLQMLQRISTRLGVRLSGDEIQELSEDISVEALARELREVMPDE